MEKPILIRTKIKNVKRFVKMKRSELDISNFIQKGKFIAINCQPFCILICCNSMPALETHKIKGNESIEIKIYDNCKTQLALEDTILAIEQFLGCSTFWIELELSSANVVDTCQVSILLVLKKCSVNLILFKIINRILNAIC